MNSSNIKITIPHRPMPAELLNELFASLPLAKAFDLLAKMPNSLLAKNVHKMINHQKMIMKANKWNQENYGRNLMILENGIVLTHFGSYGWNSAFANFSVPKLILNLAFYFEVQILKKDFCIRIGFSDQLFPTECKGLGNENNSIGFGSKQGIIVDECFFPFENPRGLFNDGDVIGIGLIHYFSAKSHLKCFCTCNGELLGSIELAQKFIDLELFPAASLSCGGASIRANFGEEKWNFNPRKIIGKN